MPAPGAGTQHDCVAVPIWGRLNLESGPKDAVMSRRPSHAPPPSPPPQAVPEEPPPRPDGGFHVRSPLHQTLAPPSGSFNFVRVRGESPRALPVLVSARLAHARLAAGRPVVYAGAARRLARPAPADKPAGGPERATKRPEPRTAETSAPEARKP